MTDKAKAPSTDEVVVNQQAQVAVPIDSSPQGMIMLALKEKADPEVLNKLMDLQERWDAKEAKKAYVEAMSAFKQDAPAVIQKDAHVNFSTAKGNTSYSHATLGNIIIQITSMLSKHGLSASWETHQADAHVKVTCHVTHSQGHRESTSLNGPLDDSGSKNKIQQVGSTVTYLQRYTLLAALGLATMDQDGDGSQGSKAAPFKEPKAASKPRSKSKPEAPKSEPKEDNKKENPASQPQEHGDDEENAIISEAQGKRLYAICKENGVAIEAIKEYLKSEYDLDSMKTIYRDQYDTICAWAEAGGQEPPA